MGRDPWNWRTVITARLDLVVAAIATRLRAAAANLMC